MSLSRLHPSLIRNTQPGGKLPRAALPLFLILAGLLLFTGCFASGGSPLPPAATTQPAVKAQPATSPDPSPEQYDLSGYPWLYLRDGQTVAGGEEFVELIAVGDVMLGRGVRDEPQPFAYAGAWLGSADLTAGNLECALEPGAAGVGPVPTDPPGGPYRLVAPAASAQALSKAGFDLLSLANNHSLDRGLKGLEETAGFLTRQSVMPLGAGPDTEAAYTPALVEVSGIRLAFLAFNAIPSPRAAEWTGEVRQNEPVEGWSLAGWEREKALEAIRSAAGTADVVVVSIHWGYEYERRPDPRQREMAEQMVAAGAGLVLGHHPHVIQRGEALGNAWVAYSLGNFVFDQGQEGTGEGLALRVLVDSQGLRAVQGLGVRAGLRPALLDEEQTGRLLGVENEAVPPRRKAFRCTADACSPVDPPDVPAVYDLDRRPVDLTGDGLPETIHLESGRLTLSQPGLPDWSSPPEWQVQTWASGDPNLDGRQELLLLVLKADRAGVVLSHPFVLGHREGEYRVIWGGSAASDPILDLRLADLDLDGRQELVVLEEMGDRSGRALSFWRWNGWGFTQIWRSEPGGYRSLDLLAGEDGKPVLLAES